MKCIYFDLFLTDRMVFRSDSIRSFYASPGEIFASAVADAARALTPAYHPDWSDLDYRSVRKRYLVDGPFQALRLDDPGFVAIRPSKRDLSCADLLEAQATANELFFMALIEEVRFHAEGDDAETGPLGYVTPRELLGGALEQRSRDQIPRQRARPLCPRPLRVRRSASVQGVVVDRAARRLRHRAEPAASAGLPSARDAPGLVEPASAAALRAADARPARRGGRAGRTGGGAGRPRSHRAPARPPGRGQRPRLRRSGAAVQPNPRPPEFVDVVAQGREGRLYREFTYYDFLLYAQNRFMHHLRFDADVVGYPAFSIYRKFNGGNPEAAVLFLQNLCVVLLVIYDAEHGFGHGSAPRRSSARGSWSR